MKLRDYQQNTLDKLFRGADRTDQLVVLPTGAGKTFVASRALLGLMVKYNARILWLVHRRELVLQANEALKSQGIDTGVIMAGIKPNYDKDVQVASIQTIARRMDKIGEFDFIFIDEAHHATAKSYRNVFEAYPKARRIGLTATPMRYDGTSLGDLFNRMILGASFAKLVYDDWLHCPITYCWPMPEGMDGIKVSRGEPDPTAMAKILGSREILGDIVIEWIKKAFGRPTICFAANVSHSKAIVASFKERGIPAGHIDAKTPTEDREQMLKDLRTGKIRVLSNVGILNEGWDFPGASCCILARLFLSPSQWRQSVGRITRKGGKHNDAIILDHCANALIHGSLINEPKYSLEGKFKKPTETLGLRTCPQCFICVETHHSECAHCGYEFTKNDADPKQYKVIKGQLIEYKAPIHEIKQRFWEEKLAEGLFMPELIAEFYHKFKQRPIVLRGNRLLIPEHATMEDKKEVWMFHMKKTGNVRSADQHYRDIFGCWAHGKNKWYVEWLEYVDKEMCHE